MFKTISLSNSTYIVYICIFNKHKSLPSLLESKKWEKYDKGSLHRSKKCEAKHIAVQLKCILIVQKVVRIPQLSKHIYVCMYVCYHWYVVVVVCRYVRI